MADEPKTPIPGNPEDNGQEPTPQEAGNQEPATFDTEYVKKLRAEAARYRTERNALEAKVKAFEQEQMTKEELAAQKLKELEEREKVFAAKMRSSGLKAVVAAAAPGLKLTSVEAAMKLLDSSAIEYDDDHNPLGVEAALSKLVKDYPFLAGANPASGDKTNPERGGRSALTLDDVKKMSPDEINARWEEVSAVMKSK